MKIAWGKDRPLCGPVDTPGTLATQSSAPRRGAVKSSSHADSLGPGSCLFSNKHGKYNCSTNRTSRQKTGIIGAINPINQTSCDTVDSWGISPGLLLFSKPSIAPWYRCESGSRTRNLLKPGDADGYQGASKGAMGTQIARQSDARICYVDAAVPALLRPHFERSVEAMQSFDYFTSVRFLR